MSKKGKFISEKWKEDITLSTRSLAYVVFLIVPFILSGNHRDLCLICVREGISVKLLGQLIRFRWYIKLYFLWTCCYMSTCSLGST